MTNREFSLNDKDFMRACDRAKLPLKQHEKLGLARQAGKWRRKKGLAYAWRTEAA